MPNPRKASWLKAATGNPGKRPQQFYEPEAKRDLDVTDAPAWMTPEAKAVFERELRSAPAGLLGAHHAALFAAYCTAIVTAERTGEAALSDPSMLHEFSKAAQLVKSLGSELGLTPVSATRAAVRVPKNVDNPFAKLKTS